MLLKTIKLTNKKIIKINVNEDAMYNFIDIESNTCDSNIILTIVNNCKCQINFSSFCYKQNKNINFKVLFKKDNADVKLNINSLTINNHKSDIKVVASNEKNVKKSSIDIQISGIINNKKSMITCEPIFDFSTNTIVATHGITIGTFDYEQIFMLISKGINLQNAKTMLIWSKFVETLKSIKIDEQNKYYDLILKEWEKND